MTKDEEEVDRLYGHICGLWLAEFDKVNWLIDTHRQAEYIERSFALFNMINEHCEDLSKVSLVACSDPIGICLLLSKYYDCEIQLLTDHPLVELYSEFYKEKFNATHVEVNPLFEDFSEHTKDSDLVIFPDFEYFIPLDMCRGDDGGKLTAAVHYVKHKNPGNSTHSVADEQEFISRLGFKDLIAKKTFKFDETEGYCALGVR